MAQLTRRTLLTTGSLAAAGALAGPWVRRARAQGAPLKVGLVLPYTGVYAVLGESITQGMELVFARENWTVAGRKIEMIKEDDEMKPPVGVRKTEKLIDSDKVDILTGPVHSGILMGMRDKVHDSKTILIVSNAGADAISRERCSRWIFRTSFSNWQPNQPMGGWVAKNVSKDVFLIAPNYQAGKDQLDAFKETFVPAGGKIVGEDYPKLGETDYAPYLTKIRQSGAKAVYAFFSGTDAVNFVKQFDQFGLKPTVKLTGAGFLTEPDVLPAQGKSALGVITGHFYTPLLDNPVNQRFVKDFREKFAGKMPDGFACQGYDTAEVIVRALKAVNGNTQDKDKLVDVIAKVGVRQPARPLPLRPEDAQRDPAVHLHPRGEGGAAAASTTCRSTRSPTCAIPAPAAPCRPERTRAGSRAPGSPLDRCPCPSPAELFGQALNGLAYGVLLFLLSVGLTLIFGMLDVVNLAHGSFYMLGAYAGLTLIAAHRAASGWPCALAPLAVGCIGALVERSCLRPLYRRAAARPGAPDLRAHLPLRGPGQVDLGRTHPLDPAARPVLGLGRRSGRRPSRRTASS